MEGEERAAEGVGSGFRRDLTKYDGLYIIKEPAGQGGTEGALLHTAVGPLNPSDFLKGGGGADVEKEAFQGYLDRGSHGLGSNAACHRSVLTARSTPERSTVNSWQ